MSDELAKLQGEDLQREGIRIMSAVAEQMEAMRVREEELRAENEKLQEKLRAKDDERRKAYDEYMKRQEERAIKALEQSDMMNSLLVQIVNALQILGERK